MPPDNPHVASGVIAPFTHEQPPVRVIFGAGALERLPDELDERRWLIVHGGSQADAAERLCAQLGERCAGRLGDVRPHVPAELAEQARARFAELGAEGLIAIGGGSAIGLAKAIALTTQAPIAAVPTTYSGSEMTSIYGITADARKHTGRDEAVRPRIAVYDPELTRALPPEIAAPSAMNALAHCVDALWSAGATPVTTLLAQEGARALREGLEAMDRERLLYGSALAGWALGVAGTALHHRVCHLLGGRLDLPHAETHSAVLPQVAALNAPAVPAAAARMAAALGADDLATAIFDLARRSGAPTALRGLGVGEDDVAEVAPLVAEEAAGNPVPVGEAEARELLRRAWAGARPDGQS
jgi:maleylacetate reductase